jgi:hypothetical protein
VIVFLVSFITKHDPYKPLPIVWSIWFHGLTGLKLKRLTGLPVGIIGVQKWQKKRDQIGSKKEEEKK